jgi:hypothetical protein
MAAMSAFRADPHAALKARIRKALADPATREEMFILRALMTLGGPRFSPSYSLVAAAYRHALADRAYMKPRGQR